VLLCAFAKQGNADRRKSNECGQRWSFRNIERNVGTKREASKSQAKAKGRTKAEKIGGKKQLECGVFEQ